MRRKILSSLALITILVLMIVPLATPVMAAPSNIVLTPGLSTIPVPITLPGVVVTGNGITNPMTIVFADPNITVSNYGNYVPGSPGSFTCDISLAAGTLDGPKEFTITDSGANSLVVYNRFFKARLPDPPGATISFVGLSIQPFWDLAGTNPVITPVAENNIVYYKLSLSVSANTDFNFFGGELGVQFPDGSYHLAAGYGALTPGVPQIPEVSLGNSFVVVCPDPYTVHAVDRTPSGVLLAKTAYGPNAVIAPTQVYGIQESNLQATNASAYVEYNLNMYGEFRITKLINLSGAPGTGVNGSFTVNVNGAGGNYTHTFTLVDGVVLPPNPWIQTNVPPGAYLVSEVSPGVNWIASGGGIVTVPSGNFTTGNVTNTLIPGSLQITKNVNLHGAGPGGISQNFTVTVTGPSYPGGISHVFMLVNGVMSNTPPNEDPWFLTNLMPGSYNVTESNPGSSWIVSGTGPITVSPGQTPASRVIMNDYVVPHTTLQTMTANPSILPPTGGLVTITVTDTNDGSVPITGAYFVLSGLPPFPGSPAMMNFVSSSDLDNVTMNPGATWTFNYTANITTDTTFTAVGHGMANGIDVTGPSETRSIVVSTPRVPASSEVGIGILIAAFAGAIAYLGIQRRRRLTGNQ